MRHGVARGTISLGWRDLPRLGKRPRLAGVGRCARGVARIGARHGMATGCDIAQGGNAYGDRMRDRMAWHAVAGYDAGCDMEGEAG